MLLFMHAQNMDNFLKWITEHGLQYTQSARVKRACGDPCTYDALLRTETLNQDWTKLLEALHLPPIKLPRFNAVGAQPASDVAAEQPGETVDTLTREQLDAINRIDSWIFTEFEYPKR